MAAEFLTDGIKKFFLAGVGAVAVTAEKSKDVLDELVKRGELTVEQGKALNEELKHKREAMKADAKKDDFSELLSSLTPEQREALKAQLNQSADTAEEPEKAAE